MSKLGTENLSQKLSRTTRDVPQLQQPPPEAALQRVARQQWQEPHQPAPPNRTLTPQVPLRQAPRQQIVQQMHGPSMMFNQENIPILNQIPKEYIIAIMEYRRGQLLRADAVHGLLMLDHTLRRNVSLEDVEDRIIKIQNLINERKLSRKKISPDQSEEYGNMVHYIDMGIASGSIHSKQMDDSRKWTIAGWSIWLSFRSNSVDSHPGFNLFFQIVSSSAIQAIEEVIRNVDWTDVPQIEAQNINLVIHVLEATTPQTQSVRQQAVWNKRYDKANRAWNHQVILVLKYDHTMEYNSISGMNLLKPQFRRLSPKNILTSYIDAVTDDAGSEMATGYNPAHSSRSDSEDSDIVVNLQEDEFLTKLEMLSEYYKRVTIHELGHIFHALLHPIEFALLNPAILKKNIMASPIYKIENNVSVVSKKLVFLEGKQVGRAFLMYAQANEREAIAELFTAMVLGAKISPSLYTWYIAHGGPKFKDPQLIFSPEEPSAGPPDAPR